MFCAIWYHLYNLKNKKNTRGGVLLLVKLQAFNTPPWVFFLFFKLYRWYQIAQKHHIWYFIPGASVWWMVRKTCRSSPSEVFLRKVVLKTCSKFTGEHLCVCSSVNFLHVFRTSFPKSTSGWLLLNMGWREINHSSQIFRVIFAQETMITPPPQVQLLQHL